MVRQIVLNLLSNAVKFSLEDGEVVLSVSIDQSGSCLIQVTDSGIGIVSGQLESIMEPFVQVDSGMNRKYESTGLGLVLVKSMAELHDAEVMIESVTDAGTAVTIEIPSARVRHDLPASVIDAAD